VYLYFLVCICAFVYLCVCVCYFACVCVFWIWGWVWCVWFGFWTFEISPSLGHCWDQVVETQVWPGKSCWPVQITGQMMQAPLLTHLCWAFTVLSPCWLLNLQESPLRGREFCFVLFCFFNHHLIGWRNWSNLDNVSWIDGQEAGVFGC